MNALLFRFYGVTAHFRDPRYNTGAVGKNNSLPIRSLRCPPPCTIHGLLCAAKGGWVDPETLALGWKMDFAAVNLDFQTCQLPQRASETAPQTGTAPSPREREFLSMPVLSLLALEGVDAEWFVAPYNPLSLGRSEDLITQAEVEEIPVRDCAQGPVQNQCVPIGVGFGTIYPSPLFFEDGRRPVLMAPKTDAASHQQIRSPNLVQVEETEDCFYIWNYSDALSQKRS